jgi:hypothetical protein
MNTAMINSVSQFQLDSMLKDAKAILELAKQAQFLSDMLNEANPQIPMSDSYKAQLINRINDIDNFFDKMPEVITFPEI